ncbi:YueI family protein [Oceanobacillus halotolerans]|uniref:YueI family protein n=1 Tax=Oceanobacillus halotolerans TaxID=2663380 RepID=UPI0013DCA77F|nr:YueI family protein [Oceanobacillus halotolerans]
MGKKDVEDYLTEGIYGKKDPNQAERKKYLGTLRERIVIALTKGQVMSDKGLRALEETMRNNRDTELIINGKVAHRFLKEEKALASKYDIPYTTITDEKANTDIGAVLTYDHAIDKENIFLEETTDETESTDDDSSVFAKIKRWFT